MLTEIPLALVAASIVVSAASAVIAALLMARNASGAPTPSAQDDHAIFVFDGHELVDASPGAEGLLAQGQRDGSDWSRMLSALSPMYPDIDEQLQQLDDRGSISLQSRDGTGTLSALSTGRRVRIALGDKAERRDGAADPDPVVYRSVLAELDSLRTVADRLSFPVWRTTSDGQIVWANAEYMEMSRAAGGDGSWPPRHVFDREALDDLSVGRDGTRISAPLSEKDEVWFDCRVAQVGDDRLFYAVNADGTVYAERQLRDFMQTLTKTFSHLPTGLAIFDRERRLALFNPALTDLTGLPVDFLAGRPTLYAVLDRLREKRMLPEPKDYGSWRRQISELEAAAADGTYSETWSLPDGRTLRVTGRPHPGGAVAILFEDISTEMTLTRRFRSELEMGQAVADALEDAIVVFAPNGHLTMVNRAYQEMWATDVGDTVDTPTVTELSRIWMARSQSTPIWGDVRDFVLHARERVTWEETITLIDGGALRCRVVPLTGGSTMVSFSAVEAVGDIAPRKAATG